MNQFASEEPTTFFPAMKLSILSLATVCLYSVAVIAAPISENVVNEDARDIHMPKDTSNVDFSGLGFLQKRGNKHVTTIIKYMTKNKKLKTTLTLRVKGKTRKTVFTTRLRHSKNNRKHRKTTTTLKSNKSKKKQSKSSKKRHSKHTKKTHSTSTKKHKQESNDSKDYPNVGKGTFFSPNRGSCGWKNTKNDLVVAVNAPDMANKKHQSDENPNCGRMVEIVNASGDKVKAQVADTVCKLIII